MEETATSLNTEDLEARVKGMYREVAEEPAKDFHFETGRPLAERLGYETPDLDLGSGSGMDVFVAALKVGDAGKVIGIDMTDEQLAKAVRLSDEAGFGNVEFRESYIEHLPLEDGSVDAVISNGVINLSPNKAQVFHEAARVLKPGGRLAIADIVTDTQLPNGVTCDASLWAACIGGAMQRDDYRAAICDAWLEIRTLREQPEYHFISDQAQGATEKYGVRAVSVLAVKP